jgi:hypothetical protein
MWLGIAVGLAALVFLSALFAASYARYRAQGELPSPPRLPSTTGGRISPAQPTRRSPGLDETEAQARRELERLYRRTGVGQAPGLGGDVRLRGGGSLSRTDYERYRSSVGGGLR